MPNPEGPSSTAWRHRRSEQIRNHGAKAMQHGSGAGRSCASALRRSGLRRYRRRTPTTTWWSRPAGARTSSPSSFVNPGDVIPAEALLRGRPGVFRASPGRRRPRPDRTTTASSRGTRRHHPRRSASGRTIKFIYIIPNYHNPAGHPVRRAPPHHRRHLCLREHRPDCRRQPLTASFLRLHLIPCRRSPPRPPRASPTWVPSRCSPWAESAGPAPRHRAAPSCPRVLAILCPSTSARWRSLPTT